VAGLQLIHASQSLIYGASSAKFATRIKTIVDTKYPTRCHETGYRL